MYISRFAHSICLSINMYHSLSSLRPSFILSLSFSPFLSFSLPLSLSLSFSLSLFSLFLFFCNRLNILLIISIHFSLVYSPFWMRNLFDGFDKWSLGFMSIHPEYISCFVTKNSNTDLYSFRTYGERVCKFLDEIQHLLEISFVHTSGYIKEKVNVCWVMGRSCKH